MCNITFGRLLAADFAKLGRHKSVYVAAAVMLLLMLLAFAAIWMLNGLLDTVPPDDGTQIEQLKMLIREGYRLLMFGAGSQISVTLFVAIIAGLFIGGEFSKGTIALTIARGADRTKVYFSKLVTLGVLTTGYILGAYLIAGILGAAFTDEPLPSDLIGIIFRNIACSCFVGWAYAAIFSLTAFTAQSRAGALGLCIAFYFLESILFSLLSSIYMNSANSEALMESLNYMLISQMSAAGSLAQYPTDSILRMAFVPLGYVLLSSAAGVIQFVKRDVRTR